MMKKIWICLLLLFPVFILAQGHKGSVESCAPMKGGKVCYTDQVSIDGKSQLQLFNTIHKWAKKNYGKDVFLSNISSNKSKGTIFVSSKIELLLNDTDKTIVKYKMYISCKNGEYNLEAKDISYQYDPLQQKHFKVYAAEDVIAGNGKGNTIAIIKDPKLFCNATFFFFESLFADVFDAAQEEAED